MVEHIVWIVASIGIGTLAGIFWKMKPGFGPMNLRIVGLVLIVVFASLLGTSTPEALNASIGILGAVAGYLFGAQATNSSSNESAVEAAGASFGDNARLAGRDINETLNNITAQVDSLGEFVSGEITKIQRLSQTSTSLAPIVDHLINTVYERDPSAQGNAIETVVKRWAMEGWRLKGFSSDFQGMDGIFLLFERPAEGPTARVRVYHGSGMDLVQPRA